MAGSEGGRAEKDQNSLAPRRPVDPTRTVRQQWLVELEDRPPASLEELNRIFQAWVEQVYHRRVHSETEQTTLGRFLAQGPVALPSVRALREAFRWSERRTVSRTGTVGMHGNTYEV